MPTAITASDYNIELRDKDGNLKQYLTPFISKATWEWNRLGGCGRCSITINKKYRDIIFDARDDIQIRVKNNDYDHYTKLLLHLDGADGATTYTAETGQIVTFVGTAQLDTAQKKFGSASLLLDGNSDNISLLDSDDWNFGAGDFTINFRARFNADQNCGFISQTQDGVNRFFIYYNASSHILGIYDQYASAVKVDLYANFTPTLNTWYHLAFVRNGANAYIFINGVSQSLTTNTAFSSNDLGNLAAPLLIGQIGGDTQYFNGWLDEIRVSKGIARWTENFTPPFVPYTYSIAPSKLVYRGYIANITPTLKVNQDIVLDVRGYFDLLKKIVVQDTGDTKTYTNKTVAFIADDIADTFIVPNSPITIAGAITAGDFTVDSIDFLDTVDNVLRTLSELQGDIEYGVDENLVFFWKTESTTITHKFFAGNNIAMLERRVNWDDLVNKLYLVGGEVDGVKYKRTAENTDSQALYYLAEQIVNNGSITTDTVADQYLGAILTEKSNPQFNIRAQIKNTNIRIEDTVPIGLVAFYDVQYDRNSQGDLIGDIIGEAADGGSDITIGLTADGGSNVTIGGQYSGQIDRISYSLSNTSGRFNIEIQLGDTVLETAAKIKKLELALSNLNQY